MSCYFQYMKSIIMPLLVTVMLLTITVGFWGGIPLIVMPGILYETGLPGFVQWILVCLSAGICFSIVCVPLVLSLVEVYSRSKGKGMLNTFLIGQGILIVCAAILFAVFYSIVPLVVD